jgi:glycosyltransferase involved in cell wall biosynthesis
MNKVYPKISIVTPSYNQGDYIELAIQSVIDQNYPNFEHIILDNCSTDRTIDILKKYDHLIWKSEPDKGQSDALNQGFSLATGDIIGWLNADDLYLPNCFNMIVNWFIHHPQTDIVYGDYRWINQTGSIFQFRREIDFDLFILKYLHVLYIPSTATFFKSRIFKEENFLDISFRYAMDYDFFLKLAAKGYHFSHISSYLADFRWHENNKSVVGSQSQIDEMKQALLNHDEFIQKFPSITHSILLTTLQWMARCKRYYLKGIKGYYLNQWQNRSVQP